MFNFKVINRAVKDGNLSDKAFRMLYILANYCSFNNTQTVEVHNAHLMMMLNICEKQVRRVSNELVEKGYVTKDIQGTSKNKLANKYTLIDVEESFSSTDSLCNSDDMNYQYTLTGTQKFPKNVDKKVDKNVPLKNNNKINNKIINNITTGYVTGINEISNKIITDMNDKEMITPIDDNTNSESYNVSSFYNIISDNRVSEVNERRELTKGTVNNISNSSTLDNIISDQIEVCGDNEQRELSRNTLNTNDNVITSTCINYSDQEISASTENIISTVEIVNNNINAESSDAAPSADVEAAPTPTEELSLTEMLMKQAEEERQLMAEVKKNEIIEYRRKRNVNKYAEHNKRYQNYRELFYIYVGDWKRSHTLKDRDKVYNCFNLIDQMNNEKAITLKQYNYSRNQFMGFIKMECWYEENVLKNQ